MRLVLLGPPGVGKGTQTKKLSEKYAIAQISMGEILRQEVKEKSEIGCMILPFMKRGELVPDAYIIEIIKKRLMREDTQNGFVLDGYPRTINQAEALNKMLCGMGIRLDVVINLEASWEKLIQRLGGRRVCKECNYEYHLEFRPPIVLDRCDNCGGGLFIRDDDKEGVIRKRLKVYKEETLPLIDYYESQGLLLRINGEGGIDEVFNEIIGSLER